MKFKVKKIIGLATLIILGAVFLFGLMHLPSKTIVWQNPADPISVVGNFVKSVFSSGDISILILGRPGAINGQTINGGGLTDTIMVINFNPQKNLASLISIPRDLWISDSKEQFKINEMLVKHKIDSVSNKIEEITGLKLDGYAVADLALVKEAIDDLGGVDVTLSRPAVDWVSGYTLSAGLHHLNGDDAVWLIRNRYDKEGDFFRERNQQQIMADLFSKFKKLSVTEKIAFINKFVINSGLLNESDLDITKLTGYAINTDLSATSLKSVVLDFTTGLFKTDSIAVPYGTSTQNVSILIPSEGFEMYGKIRSYINMQLAK
jgi:LCP family protein required for cell wall assembly